MRAFGQQQHQPQGKEVRDPSRLNESFAPASRLTSRLLQWKGDDGTPSDPNSHASSQSGHDFSQIKIYPSFSDHTRSPLPIRQHSSTPEFTSGIDESSNQTDQPAGPRPDAGTSSPAGPGSSCREPASVRLVSTHPLSFPGYRTGGGLCAVMEASPTSNLCPTGIVEEVTQAPGGTCPGTLLRPSLCSGGSTFTPGRNQVRACSHLTISPTSFVDRHTVQLSAISVLHDPTRNPANLNTCSFACSQRYFVRTAGGERTVGRFRINYTMTKAQEGGIDITRVTATKRAQSSSRP